MPMTPAIRKALQNLVDHLPDGFSTDDDQFVVDELLMQRVWIFNPDSIGLSHEEAYAAIRYLIESGIFTKKLEDAPVVQPLQPMRQGDRWLTDVELLKKMLSTAKG
jgi:hypothetical protein